MEQNKKMAFSPSADRNKEPILNVLNEYIQENKRLLEIGSGTGQHAIYLAQHNKTLQWVTSDVKANHLVIKSYLKENKLGNIHGPETLKIGVDDFPKGSFDYIFTANTLHIMSWKEAKTLFKLLGKRLRAGSLCFFYGPFNYQGKFTSPSNDEFDQLLKSKDSKSGIRNYEDILKAMQSSGFKMIKDHEMPANNRLLVFERLTHKK
ncbi:MAG: DUF938 domain-containing protein [Bdellovibrionaceae bacterium]|jgi:cyclopropane fatty-acyl-phospholipid synthase-like methyltransferase|nr:DUF938 domain-containing protein [Pseudobdellovibrionaceae bacterium]